MSELLVDEVMGAEYDEDNYDAVLAGGVRYLDLGFHPGEIEYVRQAHSIQRMVAACGGGRIYKDSDDDDAEFSHTAIDIVYQGRVVSIAAATAVALSGGDVAHYIYADPITGAVVVNTTGWPTTAHVRLGVITLVSGAWNWSNFVDHRATHALRSAYETRGGKSNVAAVTTSATETENDSGKLQHNSGATALVTRTLPTPAAGLEYEYAVMDADGIQVQAASGHTIRKGTTASASGGYIKSTELGAHVRVIGIDASTWLAVATGTWTVDS